MRLLLNQHAKLHHPKTGWKVLASPDGSNIFPGNRVNQASVEVMKHHIAAENIYPSILNSSNMNPKIHCLIVSSTLHGLLYYCTVKLQKMNLRESTTSIMYADRRVHFTVTTTGIEASEGLHGELCG